MKTKVDRFGRIVVPKDIRDRHGLAPVDEVEIEESANLICLRPLSNLPGLVEKEGILVFRGRATGDLDSAVQAYRSARLKKSRGPTG
jgi:AbrB family looped-hinge helix DNA binding protein